MKHFVIGFPKGTTLQGVVCTKHVIFDPELDFTILKVAFTFKLKVAFVYQFSIYLMLSSHQRRFDSALKRRAKRHQSVTKLD